MTNPSGLRNIVFIHAESMDGRKMGCMGEPSMQRATTNLDRLAGRGVLFRNAYSPCPVCNPSRASMWSGTYPHEHACWNNHEGLLDDVPTFMTHLEAAGYTTKTIGSLDYRWGAHSIRDRVGSWTRAANIHRPLVRSPLPEIAADDAGVHRRDQQLIDEAVAWLGDVNNQQSPFMLYLTTGLVHPGFRVAERYLDLIDQDLIQMPPLDTSEHPVLRYQRATKNVVADPPEWLVRRVRLIYEAMIATLDEMVGQVLRALDDLGLSKSTYVIFSSDHGEMAFEHGHILKRTMFEPSIHVPLIVAGPGVRGGVDVVTPVSLVDIFPTLMDMAGIEKPEYLVGESFMPQCTGDTKRTRDWAFAEYHGDRCNTGTFMLVQGPWKYIKYVGYEPLLFCLENDPWETRNVADVEPAVVEDMERLLHTVVDYEAVDRQAKEYDRSNFVRWREEQLTAGTYHEMMSKIYSGFDRLCVEDIKPWTQEDESLIEAWLATAESAQ